MRARGEGGGSGGGYRGGGEWRGLYGEIDLTILDVDYRLTTYRRRKGVGSTSDFVYEKHVS